MRNWKSTILGLFAVFGIACWIYAAGANEKQQPIKINAEDLCSGKYVIIGRLGKPYGEISKYAHVWKINDMSKAANYSLHVIEIDGAAVDKDCPIVFSQFDVKRLKKDHHIAPKQGKDQHTAPKQGDVYEGRVYETCGYDRQPEKVDAILGVQPYQYRGFGFCSFLHIID